MTRQEKIEDLQDKAQHYRISKEELDKECEENDIYLYDEVLEPIGFNTCDRCGDYGWSEQDFLWVDYFPWDEENKEDMAKTVVDSWREVLTAPEKRRNP